MAIHPSTLGGREKDNMAGSGSGKRRRREVFKERGNQWMLEGGNGRIDKCYTYLAPQEAGET